MFRLPTRVHLGAGVRRALPDVLEDLGANRVLLLSDPGLAATPWLAEVAELVRRKAELIVFTAIAANPRAQTVDRIAARATGCDVVVGLGGGSALDAAKAVAMLLRNPAPVRSFEGREQFDHPSAPMIAMPTTCGTGSEVTWVSVLSVPAEGRKISIKGHSMFPHTALVDPDFLGTLPGDLVASTGMDALTHALEALVVRQANPVSDTLATEAVRLLLAHLPRAVTEADARDEVSRAATLAGMAFGNADVGAVHCLSESIGGLFDLPHGLLNGCLVGQVLAYQREAIEVPLAALDARLGGPGDADAVIERVFELGRAVGIPSFEDLVTLPAIVGVPGSSFERIAELSAANGSNGSNRMTLDAGHYLEMLLRMTA